MELKWFQYFVVSVDAGSLSRAAELLYTSQPNVSKVVKELEEHLGVPLLERGRRGVVMTEAGQQVYKYARQMLECRENISESLRRGSRSYLSAAFMPDSRLENAFAGFLQMEKDLQASLSEGTLEYVVHQVGHRHSRLGFVFIAGGQRQIFDTMVSRRKLEFRELCQALPVLFAGPENPFYSRSSVNCQELRKLRFVQYKEEGISLFTYLSGDRGERILQNLNKTVEVESASQLYQLLLHTDMGYLGCALAGQEEKIEKIRRIPLEESGVDIRFGYLKRMDHSLDPWEEACIDCIRKTVS